MAEDNQNKASGFRGLFNRIIQPVINFFKDPIGSLRRAWNRLTSLFSRAPRARAESEEVLLDFKTPRSDGPQPGVQQTGQSMPAQAAPAPEVKQAKSSAARSGPTTAIGGGGGPSPTPSTQTQQSGMAATGGGSGPSPIPSTESQQGIAATTGSESRLNAAATRYNPAPDLLSMPPETTAPGKTLTPQQVAAENAAAKAKADADRTVAGLTNAMSGTTAGDDVIAKRAAQYAEASRSIAQFTSEVESANVQAEVEAKLKQSTPAPVQPKDDFDAFKKGEDARILAHQQASDKDHVDPFHGLDPTLQKLNPLDYTPVGPYGPGAMVVRDQSVRESILEAAKQKPPRVKAARTEQQPKEIEESRDEHLETTAPAQHEQQSAEADAHAHAIAEAREVGKGIQQAQSLTPEQEEKAFMGIIEKAIKEKKPGMKWTSVLGGIEKDPYIEKMLSGGRITSRQLAQKMQKVADGRSSLMLNGDEYRDLEQAAISKDKTRATKSSSVSR